MVSIWLIRQTRQYCDSGTGVLSGSCTLVTLRHQLDLDLDLDSSAYLRQSSASYYTPADS